MVVDKVLATMTALFHQAELEPCAEEWLARNAWLLAAVDDIWGGRVALDS